MSYALSVNPIRSHLFSPIYAFDNFWINYNPFHLLLGQYWIIAYRWIVNSQTHQLLSHRMLFIRYCSCQWRVRYGIRDQTITYIHIYLSSNIYIAGLLVSGKEQREWVISNIAPIAKWNGNVFYVITCNFSLGIDIFFLIVILLRQYGFINSFL